MINFNTKIATLSGVLISVTAALGTDSIQNNDTLPSQIPITITRDDGTIVEPVINNINTPPQVPFFFKQLQGTTIDFVNGLSTASVYQGMEFFDIPDVAKGANRFLRQFSQEPNSAYQLYSAIMNQAYQAPEEEIKLNFILNCAKALRHINGLNVLDNDIKKNTTKIEDLGCGTYYNTDMLAASQALLMSGLDLVPPNSSRIDSFTEQLTTTRRHYNETIEAISTQNSQKSSKRKAQVDRSADKNTRKHHKKEIEDLNRQITQQQGALNHKDTIRSRIKQEIGWKKKVKVNDIILSLKKENASSEDAIRNAWEKLEIPGLPKLSNQLLNLLVQYFQQ